MGEKEDDRNLIGDYIDHHRVVRHIQGSGDLLCACGKRFSTEMDFLAHRPPDYDPNPYPEEEPWRDLHTAFENGQLHPSPQTIKKIEDDFRNALKRAILKDVHKIQTHDAGEYFDGGQLFRVISTLNTLKEKGED